MAVYYVMTRPGVSFDRLKHAAVRDIAFVKDGFSWWAMLFPLFWSLFNRMWLVSLAYLSVIVALTLITEAFGASTGGILSILATAFFALEAGHLRSWSLQRKNWQTAGIVAADNLQEAEIRFFDHVARETPTSATPLRPSESITPQTSNTSVVGLTLKP